MPRVYAKRQKRQFRRDPHAVMDMPHKLMISIAVMAMVLPVVIQSSQVVEKNFNEAVLEGECRFLANSIVQLYQQGAGAKKVISINLPDETKEVCAGASINSIIRSDIVTIRFSVMEEAVQKIPVKIGHSYISMCSNENSTFILTGRGSYQIELRKCTVDSDLNGDGIKPDFYIELE